MLHCPRNVMRTVAYSGMFLATGFASALAADPTGDWRVADGVANIRVATCNGSVWGAVAWEKAPGGKDSNNPDASRQSAGLPVRRRNLDPGRSADSFQPRQQHGQGRAEESSSTGTEGQRCGNR